MEVHLLPLRLQLDQGTVAFLQRFFAPFGDTLAEPAVVVEYADAEEDEEAAAAHTGLPGGQEGGAGVSGTICCCSALNPLCI